MGDYDHSLGVGPPHRRIKLDYCDAAGMHHVEGEIVPIAPTDDGWRTFELRYRNDAGRDDDFRLMARDGDRLTEIDLSDDTDDMAEVSALILENPSEAPTADVAVELVSKLVEALDDPTAQLVFEVLRARGLRQGGGSYLETFRGVPKWKRGAR